MKREVKAERKLYILKRINRLSGELIKLDKNKHLLPWREVDRQKASKMGSLKRWCKILSTGI